MTTSGTFLLTWRILAFFFAATTACDGFAWKNTRAITQ
jgi:hypothetical protein